MIVNVLTIKHIENIQDKEPPQEVADLGGDKNDFINQQEQSLSKVRVPLGIAESGLDRALLAFVAEYNQLYSLLNTHRYNIWIAGVLLFFGVSMLLRRI